MNESHPKPPERTPPRREAPAPFDLHELIALLYRERWLGLSIFTVVFALFILYAFLATPIYRADALLKVEKQPSALSGASALLGGLFPSGASTQAEIDILRSRAVLMPAVRQLGLDIAIESPQGNRYDALRARIEKRSLMLQRLDVPAGLRGKKLRLITGTGGEFRIESPEGKLLLAGRVGVPVRLPGWSVWVTRLVGHPGRTFRVERIPAEAAVMGLRAGISAVELGVRTGIIALALDGPHPRWLAKVVDTLVHEYRIQNVRAKAAQARESLAFIDHQLPRLKRRLTQAETRYNHYRAQNHIIDVSAQTRALLAEATSLEEVLTELRLRLADLSQSYEPGFPLMRALLQEDRELEAQKKTLRTRIESLPLKQQEYIRLRRNVEIYTRLYMALLAKAQDLEVERAGTVGNVRVVEYAVVPAMPIKPDRHLLAILGVLLGGGLALATIFLKRALVQGVGNPETIEDEFGLPIFALIPHSTREARGTRRAARTATLPLLAKVFPEDPAVEAIRSLRISLDFASPKTPSPIIAFGGPRRGIGKTVLSVNLACVLAEAGERVLLVDTDCHKGHAHRYFAAAPGPGLIDLLRDGGDWHQVLKPHPAESRLMLLPAGTRVAHPEHLLEGEGFGKLLGELRENFDALVLDLPPYLGVTDGFFVAQRAPVNLLVLKAGVHALSEIRFVVKKLDQAGIRLSGFVMNDLGPGMGAYRYYGYGYGDRRDKPVGS